MSYQIQYGPDMPKHVPKKQSNFGLVGAVLVIMVCAAAIGWAIPQQVKQFQQALFPWTRTEVRQAFSEMREDLREGQSLSDAVTSFCLEIIHENDKAQ